MSTSLAGELGGGERREHELGRETERVEHMAALGGFEGTDGAPSLGVQQFHRIVGERHRHRSRPFGRFGHRMIGQRPRPAERQRAELLRVASSANSSSQPGSSIT